MHTNMGPFFLSTVALLTLLKPVFTFANDSTAELQAGGIQLKQTEHIQMLSEDLRISQKKISVAYVFENQSNQDIKTIVAFPLPALAAGGEEQDLPQIDISNPANFLNFTVSVNNQKVLPKVEWKALLQPLQNEESSSKEQAPQDVTDIVRKYGLLLSPFDPSFSKKLQGLSSQDKKALKQKGLLTEEDTPTWRIQSILYWEQIFPAKTKVNVFHQYTPAVSSSLSGVLSSKAHCPMDSQSDQSEFKRIGASTNEPDTAFGDKKNLANTAKNIDYILTTGNNWKGPIGSFQLTIARDSIGKKGLRKHIIGFCLPGKGLKVRKTNTLIEVKGTDFVPTQDLHIGYLHRDAM